MSRITRKFIFFSITMISLIVLTCFIVVSFSLTKIYRHQEYSSLNRQKDTILDAYLQGYPYRNDTFTGILVDEETGSILWASQKITGKHGMMKKHSRMGKRFTAIPPNKNAKFITLSDGIDYIYITEATEYGTLYVLKEKNFGDRSLGLLYRILGMIFILGIIISLPLAFIFGRKFTRPITRLNKNARNIASGDFSVDPLPFKNSKDEIYDLYLSMEDMREQLHAKDKLQREFIANVSHDLRTPLSIIRNCNEAISDGLLDSTGIVKYSDTCIHQVDRLHSMVSDIMNLSKLQSGDSNLKKEWINIERFTEGLLADITMIAENKKLSLLFKCEDDIKNTEILIDPSLIRRCIMNFITNGVKVSPEGSSLSLSILSHEDGIMFCVDDSGPGISPDILPNIWNRYIKNSKSGGMGLGLAINKEILTKHGFIYNAFNLSTGGARFSFLVPLKDLKRS